MLQYLFYLALVVSVEHAISSPAGPMEGDSVVGLEGVEADLKDLAKESSEEAHLQQYNNDWDGELNFVCGTNEAIYSIYSVHDNYYEDRRYEIECRQVTVFQYPLENCAWTDDYVNNWDAEVNFACPTNQVMTGMRSVHDNHYEDRRWQFRCCGTSSGYTTGCTQTNYINDWDGTMRFSTSGATTVFTGVYSVHDNYYEDRRWKITYCTFRPTASNF